MVEGCVIGKLIGEEPGITPEYCCKQGNCPNYLGMKDADHTYKIVCRERGEVSFAEAILCTTEH